MSFKIISAELREFYRLQIGHNGWTNGCGYDVADEWEKVFYGETPVEICEKVCAAGLSLNSGNFHYYSKIEAIVYEDEIFERRTICDYSEYSKDGDLKAEYRKLFDLFIRISNEKQAV